MVDDEEQIAQLLSGMLRGEGHEAEYVTDGEAALQRLEQQPFDLLVTDLRMPRMDGMDLIARAKAINPDVDALIMTAYASTETAVDALRQGVSDYLSKPFGVDDIRKAIGKCLDQRAERKERDREVSDLNARAETTEQSLEDRVGDLSFLHDLTRLIADRTTPLLRCLDVIRAHYDADTLLLTARGAVMECSGDTNQEELIRLARRTTSAGLARFGAGERTSMAARWACPNTCCVRSSSRARPPASCRSARA